MVTARQILNLADEIAKNFSPQKIVLFGSYAYGKPNEDSDVDLMVVMPHRGPGHRTATKIRLATDHPFPLDLLVRTKNELQQRALIEDWFIIEILEKGLTLYDSSNARVGAKGRSRLRERLMAKKVPQAQPV
jgi:predicted nucleotidyltransferase